MADGKISHGICPDCEKIENEKLDALQGVNVVGLKEQPATEPKGLDEGLNNCPANIIDWSWR